MLGNIAAILNIPSAARIIQNFTNILSCFFLRNIDLAANSVTFSAGPTMGACSKSQTVCLDVLLKVSRIKWVNSFIPEYSMKVIISHEYLLA